MQCPECKHENPREAKFCVFCGKQVPAPQPETVACAGCGRTVKSDFKFCPFCGHAMEKRHRAKFCARCGTSIDGASGDLPLCSRCLPAHHHHHHPPQQGAPPPPPYGTPPPPPYGTPPPPPPPYGAPPHPQYGPQPSHYGAPQPPPPYGASPAQYGAPPHPQGQYGPAGAPQYAPQPPAGYQGYPPQQAGPQICRVCQRPSDPTCLCEEHKRSHTVCRGCGRGIDKAVLLCPDCKNVTDIPGDFTVNTDDYEHKNDRDAMNALRSIKALNMAIDKLSKQFGKSWVESQFIGGGIKVTESQFPRIQRLAVLAARVLGVRRLPEIYISGDIGWTSDTYGSESDAFVVLGTYLTRALSDQELLFVLGHEIAHVKSGHAMYRTVAKVFAGYSGPRGVMGGGILGLLDMQKLLSMSIELPLLAWIRESEITGDCAGLLVVRNIEVARKVLLLQALRSPDLFKEINHEAYLKQQEEAENKIGKLSEFLSQNTPYVARRIRFLNEYAAGQVYHSALERMSRSRDIRPTLDVIDGKTGRPGGQKPPAAPGEAAGPQAAASGKGGLAVSPAGAPPKPAAPPRADDSVLRGFCPDCRAPYTVAKSRIPKEGSVQLRCQKCKKTFPLRQEDEKVRGSCPHCSEPFSVVKKRLPKQGRVHLRCQKCKGTFPLEAPSARTEPSAKAARQEKPPESAQASDKFGFDQGYDA